MKDKMFDDLGKIMDEIFEATQSFGDAFKEKFGHSQGPIFNWDEKVDYYPAHSYPPANVYLTAEKDLVFEFALAGFEPDTLDLQFQGDYLVLTASLVKNITYRRTNLIEKRSKPLSKMVYFALPYQVEKRLKPRKG